MQNKVIVIGSGLAALMCSIKCAKSGKKVIMVSKAAAERSESVMAAGGINAALNTKGENDNVLNHFKDTMKAGADIADPEAVKGLTERAPEIVKYLAKIGTMFNRTAEGSIDLRNFGGQKKKRTAFSKSSVGKQMITALAQELRKYEESGNIETYDHHSFVTLIEGEYKEAIGCIIQDDISNEYKCINGESIVICSGGMNGLFGKTTGSMHNTGEVTAELLKKGVKLSNLEFIQYHPTTVELTGKRMLVSECARGEGGRLFTYREGKKWYFMDEWYPEMGSLMPRDVVSKSIYKVCNEMNLLIDGKKQVYLDLTHLNKDLFQKKLSGLVEDCREYFNIDPSKEYIPVYPGVHYFMGGIHVNKYHETNIKNLYAAGECCMQYHGANRLGGNSTIGALYGGLTAAERIIDNHDEFNYSEEKIKSLDEKSLNEFLEEIKTIKKSKNKEAVTKIKRNLAEIMNNSMGIVRDEKAIKEGLSSLEKLYDEAEDNFDEYSSELENYNLKSMINLGRAMLLSALWRKETRGAHTRRDYPDRNDKLYKKPSIVEKMNDQINVSF